MDLYPASGEAVPLDCPPRPLAEGPPSATTQPEVPFARRRRDEVTTTEQLGKEFCPVPGARVLTGGSEPLDCDAR